MRDITIGGVSLNSLTSKQLEEIMEECEEILVERIKVNKTYKNPLLKPGLKEEIENRYMEDRIR